MKHRTMVLLLCLFVSLSLGAQSKSFKMGKWVEIQNAILKELDRSYVDTLPLDRMEKAGINAMLAQLDPYTVYVPEEELEDFSMQLSGMYAGVGAIIYKAEGKNIVINEPYWFAPCVKSGIESGDEILEINGEDVKPLDSKTCSEKMKGKPGTVVEFLVKKVYTSDTLKIKVRREQIHLPDIEYAGMITEDTGYILQTGFTEGVGDEMRRKVAELKSQGMKKLVLDLRGNGGGLLSEAVKIVSIFVPKNSLVVTSRGRDEKVSQEYRTQEAPLDEKLTVVVLVDGGSASSSEIVSGALQDLDRATIMGTRTYGKGLVQSVKSLPYGGQLKVTTAKYHTPSGRCVQIKDYSHRNEDGSVGDIPDSLTHEFKTLKGRTVRDGGGITPDIILDMPKYDDITVSLVLSGLVGQYALQYKIEHPSIPAQEDFHFDDYEGFLAYVKPSLTAEAVSDLEKLDRSQIIPFIEEEIVTRYYYQEAGVKVRLRYDDELREALSKEPVL